MKALKRTFFMIVLVLSQLTAQAQKIHVVVFCDTNDESIGKNKESERKLTMNEMQTIARYLESYGYDSEFTECYGVDCNKRNLMQVVNGLMIEPNDVVFFYYGGHGSHAENNERDPFPQMVFQSAFISFVPTRSMAAQKQRQKMPPASPL